MAPKEVVTDTSLAVLPGTALLSSPLPEWVLLSNVSLTVFS